MERNEVILLLFFIGLMLVALIVLFGGIGIWVGKVKKQDANKKV